MRNIALAPTTKKHVIPGLCIPHDCVHDTQASSWILSKGMGVKFCQQIFFKKDAIPIWKKSHPPNLSLDPPKWQLIVRRVALMWQHTIAQELLSHIMYLVAFWHFHIGLIPMFLVPG
jgi:hypothetical protein